MQHFIDGQENKKLGSTDLFFFSSSSSFGSVTTTMTALARQLSPTDQLQPRRLMGSRCVLTSDWDRLLERWPAAACDEEFVSTPKEPGSEFRKKTEGNL